MTTEALAQPRAGGGLRRSIALIVLLAGAAAMYVLCLQPIGRNANAMAFWPDSVDRFRILVRPGRGGE